ncbi:MAG: Uma2 family endonuclease, partial [Gloeocapsa sp. DLM2.Bin57]
KTQKYLPSYQEIELARQQAELQSQQERLARQQAEQTIIQAIPRLQALGLTKEQIAMTLNLSVAQINNYLNK